MTKFLVILYPP